MDWDKVKVLKNRKRQWGHYPSILTKLAWSIKDLLCEHGKNDLYLVYFRALKRKAVKIMQKWWLVSVFLFCSSIPTEKSQKIFLRHGKYFAKENFRAPVWTSVKCYCGNKTGDPKQAVSLHLACLGSQSQYRIWFLLPARRACHIIIRFILRW